MARRQSKDPYEVYETPAWAVHRLFDEGPVYDPYSGRWLDPACGNGAIARAVEGMPMPSSREWTQVDVRGGTVCDARADYLSMDTRTAYFDVCIMNPPFSAALNFAQRATSHCSVVLMLQRLNWLASAERCGWLRFSRPAIYVLSDRPGFTPSGSDQHDYAWFAWGVGHNRVTVLNQTPLSVRQAQRPKRLGANVPARAVVKPRRAA